jgi:hypothetical protein
MDENLKTEKEGRIFLLGIEATKTGNSGTRWLKNKFDLFLQKSGQNSCRAKKCQNIYIKAQFESPKHLHQTTFEI